MRTRDEILKTLQQLSKRTGFSIREISIMARMIAQADFDPLPPKDWAEPFEFPQRKVSVTGDDFDLDCIHTNVPKPDAQVDLLSALREEDRDRKAITAILTRSNLQLTALFQIYNRLLDWERFLAVRHPDPEMRKLSEREARERERMLKGFREKAKAKLRRHGIEGEMH